MIRPLLLLALLAGCGSAEGGLQAFAELAEPQDLRTSVRDLPCLGRVEAEFPVSVKTLAENLLRARALMGERGILPEDQFCDLYTGVTVFVREATDLGSTPALLTVGRYEVPGVVFVTRYGLALFHELIHHRDYQHGGPAALTHEGWETNGNDEASAVYAAQAQRLCVAAELCEVAP